MPPPGFGCGCSRGRLGTRLAHSPHFRQLRVAITGLVRLASGTSQAEGGTLGPELFRHFVDEGIDPFEVRCTVGKTRNVSLLRSWISRIRLCSNCWPS